MGNAKELTALGLFPAFQPAEAVPPEKAAVPPGSSFSSLPASPHASLYSDLPSAAPVIAPQPLQLSKELPPKQFKPTGMKQCRANCMSQGWGFPIELSQFGSWLLCPLASGSSSLPSAITETLGHCRGDPLLGPGREPAQEASQTENKLHQQKLFCQYRSPSKLRLGIAREQEHDYQLHWFRSLCRPVDLRDIRPGWSTCST